MIAAIAALLVGELRMQLRQPLALLLMLWMPVQVVLGGLGGIDRLLGGLESVASGPAPTGQKQALPELRIAADDAFAGWLESDDRLRVVPGAAVPRDGALTEGDVLAAVTVEGREVRVQYRMDVARSRHALDRIRSVAGRRSRAVRDDALRAAGVEIAVPDLLRVTRRDHAVAERRGGDRLGAVLPPLLLFSLVVVAVYTGLDVVSGEKERGTAETLLVSAVDRRAVVAAKGLITAGSAAVVGWVGLVSLPLASSLGLLDLAMVLGEDGAEALSLGPLLVLAGAVALLAVQAAGISLVMSAGVPDYRTGSMIAVPAMLAVIAPSGVVAMPGVALSPGIALVPVANVSLACRDLLAGELSLAMGALVLAATAAHAGLAAVAAWRFLSSEDAFLGGSDASGRRALGYFGRDAFVIYVIALLLMWFFGQLAQSTDLLWGMAFTQVVLIGGLAVASLGYLGLPLKDTLSLRAPSAVDLALAVPAGVLMPSVALLVAVLQDPLIPTPQVLIEAMRALEVDEQPLWVPLVVFALLPGLCEELLFRGALLGLLRRSLQPVPRVLVVAAAFGLLHLALPRLLTTGALGIVLGFVVLRTGSLWPAVLMHALNNGAALVAGRVWGDDALEAPLWAAALSALACVGLVAAMGRRGR